jgi:hypothetical protein
MISQPTINGVTVNHNTSLYLELMVLHFFCVSYIYGPTQHWNEAKAQLRDEVLRKLRDEESGKEVDHGS